MASSSSSSRSCNYDVFPSFSGKDVRKTFLSHFHKEMDRKVITTFKDNNDIERSHMIKPELIQAIRGSRISVVVLSKNYASSSWCLDELLEILKCKEVSGQVVIPVFYGVDPSDVRNLTGKFGLIFKETSKNIKNVINQWRAALSDVANMAGFDSACWNNEAEMIEAIANDVLDKLNITPSKDLEEFVGIRYHMENMNHLLRLESDEVRMVGIWGPSGIGKTVIARILFDRLAPRFQGSLYVDQAFLHKIRESFSKANTDDYNMKLAIQDKFLSEILGKKDIHNYHLGAIGERLKNQKILLCIDDFDEQVVLNALAGKCEWFGSGSRIIAVTTDKHLLTTHGIDHMYSVGLPCYKQALEIFSRAAFNLNNPPYGLMNFSREVVELAGRLPLELKKLGSSVRGLEKEACLKMLSEFRRSLDGLFWNDEVTVRVVHSWESRNVKKGQLLMGQELLLLNSQCFAVQGFIPASQLPRFGVLIEVGKTYTVRRFMLRPAKTQFRIADCKSTIVFTDQTSVVEFTEGAEKIPKDRFRTRLYVVFSAIVDKDVDLFDVLGQVIVISGVKGTRAVAHSKECVTIHIKMKDGETIQAYLWSDVAATVRARWEQPDAPPKTILLTAVNCRTIGGVARLKTTSASRVFFDDDVVETMEFNAWVQAGNPGMPTITSSSSAITKPKIVTIEEILQFLQTAPLTFCKASFIVHAKIVGVPEGQTWHYIACNTCNTKLGKSGSSLYCDRCKKTNNVGITKFRFKIIVCDTLGEVATFVVFDREGTQLLGRTAPDLLQAVCEGDNNKLTPPILQTIVGSSWKFQIQATNYNLRASRQTFSISHMVEEAGKKVKETKMDTSTEEPDPGSVRARKKPRIEE